VDGGRGGCEALFDTIRVHAANNPTIAAYHRLAFDTYCMQHVESYAASAKSYAAHLMGLCCGIERDRDPAVYDVIHRWLNGKAPVTKPPVLAQRGMRLVTNVIVTASVEGEIKEIKAWAADVWQAYESQHEQARRWLDLALSSGHGRR
jgi:hypothetical protein